MSTKALFRGVLVLALLGSQAKGQTPSAPVGGTSPLPPGIPVGDVVAPLPHNGPAPHGASMGCRGPDCHGPLGEDGPLTWEAYVRSGISIPFGGGPLARALNVGWVIEGGGRSLFFNHAGDAAWTVDFGITNVCNSADGGTPVLLNLGGVETRTVETGPPVPTQTGVQQRLVNGQPVPIPGTDPVQFEGVPIVQMVAPTTQVQVPVTVPVFVTPDNLNRTFVNLAFGRVWYLDGSAANPRDGTWRAGFDVGGRWGTGKLDLNEIRHRTSVLTGAFVAVHTDVEIPWGHLLLQAGVRASYGYTFADFLQGNNSDIHDVFIVGTLGVRF
ncbi:MAG: hypothetical protein IT429_16905 [Gemmataceae bacterium]|nr:hypothetical protein [Gemmataceae bacterium]